MIGILDYLFGTAVISVAEIDTEKTLNLLHKNMIYMKKMPKLQGDYFSFTVSRSNIHKVEGLLDKSGIKVYSIRRRGLPFLIGRYRKRYGMFVGAFLFCLVLWLSGFIVWELDISGNDNISDTEVEKQLMDIGFGVGSYIPGVDLYTLCNDFLVSTEDFSFISVNMEGTKAHIELRERKKRNKEDGYQASNIVAKYSGVIESMTVYTGQTVVEKEAVVKEGDLLVSGFLEKSSGFEIVRSTGSVYAYVTRTFEVEIPFEKQAKIYTDNSQDKIDVTFFGKTFGIKNNIDESFELFDEYSDRERLVLFDKIKLPIICTKTIRREYKTDIIYIDEKIAKKEAEQQMSRLLAEELVDSEILERKTTEEIKDNSYKLTCSIYCLSDIAEEKEILLN